MPACDDVAIAAALNELADDLLVLDTSMHGPEAEADFACGYTAARVGTLATTATQIVVAYRAVCAKAGA